MSIIQDLHTLADDPQKHADYAISLLTPRQGLDVILASLTALSELPSPEARLPLLKLFNQYDLNGPKHDPGAHTRRAILDALRPIALPDDVPLLLDAVTTYEFLPPEFTEEADLLRSGALLILNELDESLARYHAARLLVDGSTQEMSGEPALTAVRILESQDQLLPLYQFVMSDSHPPLPDVVSECLRSLTGIPNELLPTLIKRYRQTKSGVITIGLCDLLINHDSGPQELEFLATSIVAQQDLDVYRYLVIALLSPRKPILLSLLTDIVDLETDDRRIAIVIEATEIFSADPDIALLSRDLRAGRS